MSDILLATKFHVPPLHGNLVRRPHLVRRLNDGIAQNRRLTLISAPPGYGKSTLLSEWISQINAPVAWLSLAKGENNPARFWSYFASALNTIPHLCQAGIGKSLFQALQPSPQTPSMEGLLTNLVNDISRLEERAILVLDDLHTISETQIHRDLVFLIDHLPQSRNSLHLVAASRMDPPWPLARWRVREELIELRPADLRFSYEETLEFLNRVLQLRLLPRDIAALRDRTEGWIAGLQMAALSMQGYLKAQGAEGVLRFIETFTGSHRFILDYLMEEVVSQQPAEIQDFLHETSILEQVTAPLCDALSGRHDGQAILNLVEHSNLFLIPLDDERKWYRYHHLFADLLRKRLEESQPDLIILLHQRASEWYAKNNILSEAIRHALDAGDVLRVNEYVSGNVLAMVEHVELLDVLRHFEEMPENQISAKPWLGVAYAWSKAYVDPSGVDQVLQRAEQSLLSVENDLERKHLISHLAAVRAYVAWVKGKAEEALEFTQHALENLPEDDWVTRCHVLNTRGLALQYQNNLIGSAQSLEEAAAAGQRTGRAYVSFYAYSNLAFGKILQGQLRQAFSLCQYILSQTDDSSQVLTRLPVLAYVYATMSMVQLEWNEVESAILSARKGVALAEQWNQADTLHFAMTCLSEALCAAGDLEEAFAVNQRAMQLAVNVSRWFFRLSAYDEINLNLAKGDITAAANRFAEIEPLVEERDRRGGFMAAKAALLYAQGRYSDAISALEQPVCELEQSGNYWYLMKLMPLQALALQASGREKEGLKVLEHCLTFAIPEGYVRIFVRQGAPMARLLQVAASRGIHPEYINGLLPAFDFPGPSRKTEARPSPKSQPAIQKAGLVEPLSEREIQVLRLLNSSLTSEEIGRELYVSTNTARTHIRNIYAKLGVNRRGEAVRLAKELKLICG